MKHITIVDIINNKEETYLGNLRHYYYAVLNGPHKNNPYHNNRHLFHVVWETYEALKTMNITGRAARNMVLSAMWHDFGHAGNHHISDADNINTAKKGFIDNIDPIDKTSKHSILRGIEITEVASTGERIYEPQDLGESILQDADLGETFSVVWQQDILNNLAIEKGITWQTMLKKQTPFLKSISFHTEWAKKKFMPITQNRLLEVEAMKEILLKKKK
jgi:hypothetical protein